MAIAVSFSPVTPKLYATTTASVSGGAATTSYFLSVSDPQGHTKTLNFKTDGSGNASIPIVPVVAGAYTVNIYLTNPVSQASGSFNSGHS